MSAPEERAAGSEGVPDCVPRSEGDPRSVSGPGGRRSADPARSEGDPRSTSGPGGRRSADPARSEGDPRSTSGPGRRGIVVGVVVVVVLAVDAVLLAWTEMAWLTLRTAEGGVPVPLAALVALLTTPVLVLAADAAMPDSRAPTVPLAVWTLTVVVAGLWSPAGAGVLPPDWRAILLLAAGVLPGALALSWRSARAARRRGGARPTDDADG